MTLSEEIAELCALARHIQKRTRRSPVQIRGIAESVLLRADSLHFLQLQLEMDRREPRARIVVER